MKIPLVDGLYILEKFKGKGGWTYALIPEIKPAKHAYFGWVKVKGSIDGYPIEKFHLMPMGNGQLFLSVKAEIRKIIKKQAGDTVHIILFAERELSDITTEWIECLQEEPNALKNFHSLTENAKKKCLQYIDSAKTEDEKVKRITECIDILNLGTKFIVSKK